MINQDCHVCNLKLPPGSGSCSCEGEICSACADFVSVEMCSCLVVCDSPRCFWQFLERMPKIEFLRPEQIAAIPLPTFVKED